MSLPTDAQARKNIPVYSGFIKYFPDAICEVARLSKVGNDQHNPGQPLHWAKEKSSDELDALMRHLIDDAAGVPVDTDGIDHAVKVAWRAMANLQRLCDARNAALTEWEERADAEAELARVEPADNHPSYCSGCRSRCADCESVCMYGDGTAD